MPLYPGSMGAGMTEGLAAISALNNSTTENALLKERLKMIQQQQQSQQWQLPVLQALLQQQQQGGGAGGGSGMPTFGGGDQQQGQFPPYKGLDSGPSDEFGSTDQTAKPAPDGTQQSKAGDKPVTLKGDEFGPFTPGEPKPVDVEGTKNKAGAGSQPISPRIDLMSLIKATMSAGVPKELVPDVLQSIYPYMQAENRGQIDAINATLRLDKEKDLVRYREQQEDRKWYDSQIKDAAQKASASAKQGQLDESIRWHNMQAGLIRARISRVEALTKQGGKQLANDPKYQQLKNDLNKAMQFYNALSTRYAQNPDPNMESQLRESEDNLMRAWEAYDGYSDSLAQQPQKVMQHRGAKVPGVEPAEGGGGDGWSIKPKP